MTCPAGVREVATFLPSRAVPITAVGEELGLSSKQLRIYQRYYGLSQVLRDPGATATELLLAAAGKLKHLRGREHAVRYVIQARTMPVVAPYPTNVVHEVRDALRLERAEAFAIFQHACASGLFALDLAGRLLTADRDPAALALVLTGEKTFTTAAKAVPDTALNGEAAAAVLVGFGQDQDRVLSYETRTYGRFYAGLTLTGTALREFHELYPRALAQVIRNAVTKAGLTLNDIELLLPHNINRVSWLAVSRLLELPLERIYLDNVSVTGHCFCADPFLNYRSACDSGRLRPGERYLMVAVGLGATFSAMAFRH